MSVYESADDDALLREHLKRFDDTLSHAVTTEAIMALAVETLARCLKGSSAGYAAAHSDATLDSALSWAAPGVVGPVDPQLLAHCGDHRAAWLNGTDVAIDDLLSADLPGLDVPACLAMGARAVLQVPVRERGELVALCWVLSAEARHWSLAQRDFAWHLATRTRSALERAGERRREQRFALLAEAAAGLLDATDPDTVLAPILAQGKELLGFDESYSYVLPPDCEHLHLTHSIGASEAVRATLVKASFDLPICGVVAQTRRPLILSRLQQTTEPRYEVGRQCGYNAFAAFPVMDNEKLHGVMSFAARDRAQFDDESIAFFATLARYVAVVRLRQETQAKLQEFAENLELRVEARTAELLSVEATLRQSQKMEAVGQLTGGLAHDFNNLLTGITGSLELLQSRVAQGRIGEVDRYVNAAQGAARRAAALTHRLLAFSRRQTLAPKAINVNRLVLGMEELIRRTIGPQIIMEPPVAAGGLWPTLVDPSQLENALLNLCINARDAMPDGGQLTLETGNRWLDERGARERDLPPGQYVTLCVSDNGSGMPPEVVSKAFDPFFTTKPIGQGTGLGLSMIYGFARQSNGQVRIYSEVGQGTMVCLYLPRYQGEEDSLEGLAEPVLPPRAQQGETVLVIDDEPTVRMLVADVLGDLGYKAIEAADGAAGLKVLESDMRIDLLVTDVGLPGGMNGRQVADAARVARPDLKILFITGYAENAVLSHGHLDVGMHVLTKPFTMEALAARIEDLINAD